eukprot:208683_1
MCIIVSCFPPMGIIVPVYRSSFNTAEVKYFDWIDKKIGGHSQHMHMVSQLLVIWSQKTSLKHDVKYYQHEYHLVTHLFVLISWYIICIFIMMEMKMGKNQHEIYKFIYWHMIVYLLVILHKVKVFADEYHLVMYLLVVVVWCIMPIYWYYSHCGCDEKYKKKYCFLDFYLNNTLVSSLTIASAAGAIN